jgi:hypothetical protein
MRKEGRGRSPWESGCKEVSTAQVHQKLCGCVQKYASTEEVAFGPVPVRSLKNHSPQEPLEFGVVFQHRHPWQLGMGCRFKTTQVLRGG